MDLAPLSAKSLSTNFTLTPQASGNWANLTMSMAYQRAGTAPTKARAVLTWQQAGVFKRAYTSALTLSGSSWTTATAKFSSGDTLPTTLSSLPCLLEVYFWGTSTTPNSINVDDLKLLCDSLSNVWTMTPASLAEWSQSKPYWAQFGVQGYASTITWSNGGTLPPGLTFDTVNGRLTGTPTTQGTYSFTVTATGAGLAQTTSYTFNIAAPPTAPPAVPALAKWTWDSDSSATTLTTLPAGDVNTALTEVSYGYAGSSTMTGGLHAGGSSFTSGTPVNTAGAGQMRSFSGWETGASYATTRSGLLHFNSGATPRFAVYPAANTASLPTTSQTSMGESGALQTRLKFDANSIGDVKAFSFDALRWQSGRMDISGSNGPRWAELHAYWLNDSGVMQRWDSAALDITAVYRPENRGANQFGRFWFDLDSGSTGLNQRIKTTTQRYRASRQVFFDLYFYHDTGADVSGIGGSNPPSLLVDEMAVLGSMTSTAPLVSLGNAVFNDTNYNGRYDAGEGVSGVSVQLLNTSGTVLQTTTTGTGGSYLFSGLAEGNYIVKIPATEFAASKPLNGLVSITGNGTDNGVDDGSDENGIDNAAPATNGIVSSTITLYSSSEPTTTETGFNGAGDDASDDATDLTVDFGFQSTPPFSIGDRVFNDSNGNSVYDPGEGIDGVTVQLLSSANVVLATQTTSGGGRYLFTGLSSASSYYVRVATSNFSGAGLLTSWISLAGNGSDNGADNDDNGVDDAATTTNGIKSVLITPRSNQGGVFSHTWPTSASATLSHAGGTWEQVFVRNDYNAKTMDVSVTLDTTTQNTQALWMVITNGTSAASTSSNLAAIYVANGQVKVTPYTSSGTSTHTLGTVIYSTTCTTTNVGTKRTFRFTLDTNAINQWAAQPATWQGTGFPYDAQGSPFDFTAKKIGLRLRSFADGAATLSGSAWTVMYGTAPDTNVGSFDEVTAVSEIGADVAIEFGFRPNSADYGDYAGFTQASSGATAALRIGATIDGENSLTPNAAATSDDTTGSDDEDGVTLPATLSPGGAASVVVNVTNTTGLPGYLSAWIDFDGDGVLTGAGEQIASDVVIATGTSNSNRTINVTVPTIAALQQVGVRVRLSSSSNAGPEGLTSLGEVEDYTILIACPTITMSPTTLPAAMGGSAYDQVITGASGSGTYQWSLASGSLPPGLALQQGDTGWTGVSTSYPNVFAPAGNATVDPPNGALLSIVLGGSAGPVQSGVWSMKATGGAGISVLFLGLLETGARTEIDGSALKFKMSNNSSTLLGALGVGTAISTTWEATATLNQAGAVKALQPNKDYTVSFYVDGSNGLLQSGLGITPTFSVEFLDGSGAAVASASSGTLVNLVGLLGTGVTTGTVSLTFHTPATVPAGAPGLRFKGSSILNTTVLGLGTTFATINNLRVTELAPESSVAGRITGTPVCTPGTYNFTVQAKDMNTCIGTRAYALTVNVPSIAISPSTLPSATAGVAYNQSVAFAASGGTAPYTYTVSGLPAGMSFNAATNKITGTATQTGSYTVTVETKDSPCCGGTTDLTLSVVSANNLSLGNLVWEDRNNNGVKDAAESGLAGASVRLYAPGADNAIGGTGANADTQVGSTQVTVASGSYVFNNLAAGKYFVRVTPPSGGYKTGGTPVTLDNGTDNDNNGSQPGGVGASVYSPVITLLQGTEPTSDDADNNTDLTIDIGLWPGFTVGDLVFDDANNNGLRDSGEAGLSGVTVQFMSPGADLAVGGGNDVQLMSTTTNAAGAYNFNVPQTGSFFVRVLPSATRPKASTSVFGDNGVNDDNNGSQPGGAGTYSNSMVFALQPLSEPGTTGTTNVESTIDFGLLSPPVIAVSPPILPKGYTDNAYSQTVSATGGTGPYTFDIVPGELPPGLGLDVNTGVISGVPINTGTFDFIVRATDRNGFQGERFYTVEIGRITISPEALPPAYESYAYSQVLSANGGTASYTWSVISGALPPGLSLSVVSGQIAGTPTTVGTYDFVVRALDANGFHGTKAYTLPVLTTVSVGNLVFEDYDNNGRYDPGEGIDGVTVELYFGSQTPGADTPVASTITTGGGRYAFGDLEPDDYVLYLPASQFGPGGFLRGLLSLPGVQSGDDDLGEDGLDSATPPVSGIRTAVFTLTSNGAPTDATTETGFDYASDNASAKGDDSADLTKDFGFYRRVAVGNLIFYDANGNGRADSGEGLNGVVVQLYNAEQIPEVDVPLAMTMTAGGGRYLFDDLRAGLYRVHVPSTMFQTGAPLHGMLSIAQGLYGDDDVGEDGLNTTFPPVQGVSTNEFLLYAGIAPTLENSETGIDSSSDDDLDAAIDLTIDLGFQRPTSVGNLVFIDANLNGRADAGEGADGVWVELYEAGAIPSYSLPVRSEITSDGGHYRFADLPGGAYFVHLPVRNFYEEAPLYKRVSMVGTAATNSDDSVGEDGQDAVQPDYYGISSVEFTLLPGDMPVDSAVGSSTGENGFMASEDNANAQDANGNMTIDLGFVPLDPNKVGVGNVVFRDSNGNGRFDEGEGVEGVLLHLLAVSTGSTPLAITTTDAAGNYAFRNLNAGSYYVVVVGSNFSSQGPLVGLKSLVGQGGDDGTDDDADENGDDPANPGVAGVRSKVFKLQPGTEPTDTDTELGSATYLDAAADANHDLTIDFGFADSVGAPLAGRVRRDLDQNGTATPQDAPLAGVEVAVYQDANRSGTLDATEMSAVELATTGADGQYVFTDLAEGRYIVAATPLPGATAESDSDGGAPDQTVVELQQAPMTGVDFLQSLAPTTYAQWQAKHSSGGPGDNADADGFDNLLEYALGLDPESGVMTKVPFEVVAAPGGDALLRRPALARSDVRLILEGSTDAQAWHLVTLRPRSLMVQGEEVLHWINLASDPLFAGQTLGYVRLRVSLDADLNGRAEHSSVSATYGFTLRQFQTAQATLSMPLVRPELYAGQATAVDRRHLSLQQAVGWQAALVADTAHYVEIMDGPHAGLCLDILAQQSADEAIALAADVPVGYAASRVALRPHRTLATLLPPSRFHAAQNAAEADRVLFYEQGAYRVHWLALTAEGSPRWLTDATLQDTGAQPVRRDDGLLVHPRHAPVELWFTGQLPAPRAPGLLERGRRLLATAVLAGPSLAMRAGDKLCLWRGDLVAGETGYVVHLLTDTGWVRESDGMQVNVAALGLPFRAVVQVAP